MPQVVETRNENDVAAGAWLTSQFYDRRCRNCEPGNGFSGLAVRRDHFVMTKRKSFLFPWKLLAVWFHTISLTPELYVVQHEDIYIDGVLSWFLATKAQILEHPLTGVLNIDEVKQVGLSFQISIPKFSTHLDLLPGSGFQEAPKP